MSASSSRPQPVLSKEGRFYVGPVGARPLLGSQPSPAQPFGLSLFVSLLFAGAVTAGLALYQTISQKPIFIPPTEVVETAWKPLLEEEPVEQVSTRAMTPPPPPAPAAVSRPVFLEPTLEPPVSPPAMTTAQLLAEASSTFDTFQEIAEYEAEELEKRRLEEEREKARLAKLEQERREREKKEAIAREKRAALAAREKAARDARNRELAQQRQEEKRRQAAVAREQAEKRKQAALAKKVASFPAVTRRVPPSYPTSARRQGAEGTTRLSFTVTTSGKVSSPQVTASSGHRSLDSAALKAVKKWRFSPARNGLGQPIAYQVRNHAVTFRLN